MEIPTPKSQRILSSSSSYRQFVLFPCFCFSLFFFLFFPFAIANPLRSNTIHNAHKPSQSLADNNTHNYHGDDGDGGYYC